MAARPVDFEAAWYELQGMILTRDGWGTRTLVTEMAVLRAKYTEAAPSASGGMPTETRDAGPGSEDPEEGHDVGRNHAGRRLHAAG